MMGVLRIRLPAVSSTPLMVNVTFISGSWFGNVGDSFNGGTLSFKDGPSHEYVILRVLSAVLIENTSLPICKSMSTFATVASPPRANPKHTTGSLKETMKWSPAL